MKKKNRLFIYPLTIIGALALLIIGCKKDTNNPTNNRTNIVFNTGFTYGNVTDVDGNVYKTISIGTQTWMAENLRTKHYRNGEIIPNVTNINISAWYTLTSGACCSYKNTSNNDSIAIFGRLYNFYAANDSRNLAPEGWHVPSQTDWQTLITYLGGASVAGNKLKETFTLHWKSPSAGTNESGFTALPAGWRTALTNFDEIGKIGGWWSNTKDAVNSKMANCVMLYYNYDYVDSESATIDIGFSIRCIKD